MFPLSPLCTCLSVINHFGAGTIFWAALMGLSASSLMSIVHYVLLDYPGVLREQSTSTSDRSRPGDLYYPNFHLDCLTGARLNLLLFLLLLLRLGCMAAAGEVIDSIYYVVYTIYGLGNHLEVNLEQEGFTKLNVLNEHLLGFLYILE